MAAADAGGGAGNVGTAFAVTSAAGFATILGAAAVFIPRLVELANKRVLAAALGFASGFMLYVSFIEIFVKSMEAFQEHGKGEADAYISATVSVFAGMAGLKLISGLANLLDSKSEGELPDRQPKQSARDVERQAEEPAEEPAAEAAAEAALSPANEGVRGRLQRMGLKTAFAIALHNLPEGLATFVATLADPAVGARLAVGIAVHNMPEGLCVALPIFYATQSRWKGLLWSAIAGLSEPLGAAIGWLVVSASGSAVNQLVYGVLFGLVGGMMVMLVLSELIPTAHRYDPEDSVTTFSTAFGMLVMALSLCIEHL